MKRIHELILNDGDAQSYNRLGITYTEGSVNAWVLHPDSQHSEQAVTITRDQVNSLKTYLEEIEQHMDDAGSTAREDRTP